MSHPRLVTPQGIAQFLGTSIADNNFLANLMCSMASQLVRSYTQQMISYVDGDERTLDGTGRRALILPELPVVRVNSVTVHDSDGENPEVLEETDYVVDESGILWRTSDCDYWTSGVLNVTVDYDHGWDVGVDTGSDEVEDNPADHVPADILLVALRVAARGFLAGQVITGGGSSVKASESITPESYAYTNVASDAAISAATSSAQQLAADEMEILDRYAQRRVA